LYIVLYLLQVSKQKGGVSQQKGGVSQQKVRVSQQKGGVSQKKGGVSRQKRRVGQQKGGVSQQKGKSSKVQNNLRIMSIMKSLFPMIMYCGKTMFVYFYLGNKREAKDFKGLLK